MRWPRGKGLGGSSTSNFMGYARCSPKDFDQWAHDFGNAGWSFKEVLPYYKKMENYQIDHLKGRTDYHGYDGPLKINERFQSSLGHGLKNALINSGYPFTDDINGENSEAFGWAQFNIDDFGRRMSTAKVYLRPAMERPNLHVVVNAHVTKVSFSQFTVKNWRLIFDNRSSDLIGWN